MHIKWLFLPRKLHALDEGFPEDAVEQPVPCKVGEEKGKGVLILSPVHPPLFTAGGLISPAAQCWTERQQSGHAVPWGDRGTPKQTLVPQRGGAGALQCF